MTKKLHLFILLLLALTVQGQTFRAEHFTTADGLPSNVVNTMIQDSRGYLWLGTNVGLTRFDGYRFVNFYHEADGHRRTENITGIAEDTVNNMLLVAGSEYYIYTFSLDSLRFAEADSVRTLRFYELHPSKNTSNTTIHLSWERGVECRNNTRRNDALNYVTLADSTEVWTTIDNGFYVYDPRTQTTYHSTASDAKPTVESDCFSNILLDRSGTVWMSNYATGLYQLSLGESGVRYHQLAQQPSSEQAISVRSFSELADGRVLVTNMAGDVWCYDLEKRQGELMIHRDYRVYATLTDPQGRLWTGLRNGGVWAGDRHLNTSDSLTAYVVFHLFRSSDGAVWISTLDGGLVAAHEQADGGFRFRTYLPQEKVHQVDADAEGRLWVATESGVFAGGEDGFRRVYDGAKCVGVCCTGDGRVLVATIGQGLLIIEGDTHTFLTTAEGLANDCAKAVCWDPEIGIVCATDAGITVVGARGGHIHNIYSPEGMMADTYNESAALRMSDGRILLGSLRGFVELRQGIGGDIAAVELRPVVTGITVNDVAMYRQHFTEINLPYNRNNLAIDFSCLSYKYQHSTIYSYWLEGFDGEWRPSTSSPQALYNNLSPGSYRFHVRAAVAGGEWGEDTVCDICIAQPWWWTWWMRLIYVSLIALLVWYETHQYRLRLSLRRQLDQRLAALYAKEPTLAATEPATEEQTEQAETQVAPGREVLDKLDRIISANLLREDIDIAFLASEMCMSHSTLYRRIKTLTGMTANEYVRKHRLAKSMQLLRDGLSVSDVSFQCGFSSANYFRRCFKAEYGILPSEYRAPS